MTKQNHWISSYGCVYNVNYHFVWSTKYRRKVLVGDIAERLKDLHKSIASDKGFDIAVQEVQPDHVHLFIRAHPKFSPSTITKILKGITAKKLFEEYPELRLKTLERSLVESVILHWNLWRLLQRSCDQIHRDSEGTIRC